MLKFAKIVTCWSRHFIYSQWHQKIFNLLKRCRQCEGGSSPRSGPVSLPAAVGVNGLIEGKVLLKGTSERRFLVRNPRPWRGPPGASVVDRRRSVAKKEGWWSPTCKVPAACAVTVSAGRTTRSSTVTGVISAYTRFCLISTVFYCIRIIIIRMVGWYRSYFW